VTLCGGLHSSLALVVLGAGSAVVTPTPVSIEFDAPPGCSDARTFFERLRARTDRVRPARPGDDPLKIEVKLVRLGAKVHGELVIKQEPSESAPRMVDGATCDEVVGVLSLTAALALEHLAPARNLPAEPGAASSGSSDGAGSGASSNAGNASASAASAGVGAENSNASDARKPDRSGAAAAASGTGDSRAQGSAAASVPLPPDDASNAGVGAHAAGQKSYARFEFGGQVGLSNLTSPLLAVGAGGLLRVRAKGASFGLSASYWSNALTRSDGDAELRAVLLGLSVCPVSWQLGPRAALDPCALANLGWLHLADPSAVNPREADRSFWGLGALARLRAAITPLVGLEVEAGVSVPLVNRRFVTNHPERIVAETPWICPIVGLAAVLSP